VRRSGRELVHSAGEASYVNGDDFGLTAGLTEPILELHEPGVLTSTTLMAKAAVTDDAIELARSTPSLAWAVMWFLSMA